MILIAVAAASILYAYVVGFIGNTTGSQGQSASLISIDNSCISASNRCPGGTGFDISIRNVGSNTMLAGTAEIYFTNLGTGASFAVPCTIFSAVQPNTLFICSGGTLSGYSQGQIVSVKVVNPDGGTTIASTRVSA